MRRYTAPRGARTSVKKPMIFWDQGRERYIVKTPYSEKLRNDLIVLCPSATYLGSSEQAYSVKPEDLHAAKTVVAAIFGEYDFIEKPPDQTINIADVNGAGAAALSMFSVGGYDVGKQVYSMLIKKYHPDLNPNDPEAKNKAAQITTAWKEIKQALGWS